MAIEIEGNCKNPDQETMNYRLNHTMLRVKDPIKSVDFYTRVMGMKLLRKIDFPAAKFSLYFLGSFDDNEKKISQKLMKREEAGYLLKNQS